MAWPNTPLTTYVGGTTPWISAVDLNALQSGINGIINGTYSVKSLVADGTGGAVVAPEPGSGRVSAAFAALGPANPSIPLGGWGRGGVPIGWGRIRADGVVLRGYNILSATRFGPGSYRVVLNASPANTTLSCALVTPVIVSGQVRYATATTADLAGNQAVNVEIAGTLLGPPATVTPIDTDFSIIVFGE